MAQSKKSLLNGLPFGSEAYVLAHWKWRKSRGKLNPTENLTGINDPRRSLLIAQRHQVQFSSNNEKAYDNEFEDKFITSVESYGQNSYAITCDFGTLGIKTNGFVPKVGHIARYYRKGFGYTVRGVDIEGMQIRYRSIRQEEIERKKYVMKDNRKKKQRFLKEKKTLDDRFDSLPIIFQQRILIFRKNNLSFRWEYESSEISMLEESLRIANYLHSKVPLFNKVAVEEIHPQFKYAYQQELARVQKKVFDYSEKKLMKVIPNFGGGHSGNSHGFVFRMAFIYLTNREYAPHIHGWLATLCGCSDYGCHRSLAKKEKMQLVKLVA
ncbi:hypothetical protein KA405_03905 [Patescibacteria group bacterium]|nr:hypothetical protein [Patescibacteria group bacterium]